MKKRIILASSSPYRAALLKRAGIAFDVVPPRCDESLPCRVAPEEAVLRIALRKMEDVAGRVENAVVIASDQTMEFEGEMVGKPGSQKRAVESLLRLAGKEHRLLTSLVVKETEGGHVYTHLDIHRIKLRNFTRNEARRYVRLDRPLDCAGAIKIESRGILLMEKAEGRDYTAVIGLPMMALAGILKKIGVEFF
jgi:septum formation protein